MPFNFETTREGLATTGYVDAAITAAGGQPLTSFAFLNNTGPAVVVSYVSATYSIIHFNYSLTRNGETEGGQMSLGTNGVTSFLTQTSQSTTGFSLGVTFTADYSAGAIRLMYTSTNTGFGGTIKYRPNPWLA